VDAPRELTQVRPATPDDHEGAAEALALAFEHDPAWGHLLPDDSTRAERLLLYFTTEIESQVPGRRRLWVTEDGAGAAVWADPGNWRIPIHSTLAEAVPMTRVFGRRLPLALRALLRIEGHHPKPHHHYLQYLGVEPRRQGRGLGGALLRPVLDHCDSEGIPAYLESSSDRNRVLYERNGFAITSSFDLPSGGPPIREMWRDPARSPTDPSAGLSSPGF
jgi:GNAT superfamily N-acetyltransferase